MLVRFTGAGGLVECSTSTTAKRRDVIARVLGQNGAATQALIVQFGGLTNVVDNVTVYHTNEFLPK
jgi:hypothetical protein